MMGKGTCLACHFIKGNPMMVGQVGPNLTHVASRSTIAAALVPQRHEAPGAVGQERPPDEAGRDHADAGLGQWDPQAKMKMPGGLTDQQIADIVAYLQLLK